MALPTPPSGLKPTYTGNEVAVLIGGRAIGLVQTATVSITTGIIQVHQTGTNIPVDLPAGPAGVTFSLTNAVSFAGQRSLTEMGLVPTGSLVNQINARAFDISLQGTFVSNAAPNATLITIFNAKIQQVSLQVPQTNLVIFTGSYVAQNATVHASLMA